MTVYIEYVLIDNLLVDYLLLKTTHYLLKREYSKLRLFFSALLGAFFALLFPLYSFGGILELLIKFLMGVIMVLLSSKYKNFKDGLGAVITFLVITFAFGGAVYAIFNLLNIKVGTEFSIAVSLLPVFCVYKILKRLIEFWSKNKEVSNFTYDITAVKNGVRITGKAFLDTGNLTFFEGKPVVFTSLSFLEKTLSFKDLKTVKKIKITTASGEKENYCFLLDEFGVFYNDKWNIYNNVWASVVTSEILGRHDALFGTAFLEGINAKITA